MKWEFFPEVDDRMAAMTMERLVGLRRYLKFALPVTSSFRDEEHNKRVGGSPGSAHLIGRAVDIAISGERAYLVVKAAPMFGFTGIGIRQRGRHDGRFIHIDDSPSGGSRPRPRIWSY